MEKDNILAEIERLQAAIKKSNSPCLKRDFGKRVAKLQKELWRLSKS